MSQKYFFGDGNQLISDSVVNFISYQLILNHLESKFLYQAF